MTTLADVALERLIERLHGSVERRGLAGSVLGEPLSHRALAHLSRRRAAKVQSVFVSAAQEPVYLDVAELGRLHERFPYRPYRADPARRAQQGRRRAAELRRALPRLAPSAEFLELACGDGLVALNLCRAGHAVTAIDLRDSVLSPQVRRSPVRYQKMDAAKLEFESERFDVVYSYDAFEHFAAPEVVLREAVRVLRPGGHLFLSFGPLYFSPWGAHQWHCIAVPYCHLLFAEGDLREFASARGQPPVALWNLNRWSIRQYRHLWDCFETHLRKLRYFEKYHVGHLDLIRQYPSCFRSETDCFDDLIIRSVELLAQKW